MAEKLCGVSDLTAGLGQRLAHLQCHQQGQVVDPLMQQLERPGQHVGPLAGRGRGEAGLSGDGGIQGGLPVRGGGVGHRAQRRPGSRVDDIEGAAVRRVDPLAVDEQPLFDGADHAGLLLAHRFPFHRARARPIL